MADTKLAKVGITVKESWKDDISYEVLDYTLWRVQDGGDGCGYIAKRANIGVVPNSDDSVWIKATQAGQSIYDLAVKYGHFVGTEEEFEAEYQAVLQAARDAASETSATNAEIQEAEELRRASEDERADAEAARQESEIAREATESDRQIAENMRQMAETQRGENETTRQSQEAARESSETQRQSNESTRQSNETARESAEQERTADFEALKTDMETAIGEADAATAAAVALNNQVAGDESARQQAEQSRVAAETQRQTAETQRGTNESTRQTQETARQTAEQTRNTQETARQTAEGQRATAEQGRASAESGRVSAETSRVAAETARETQATTDHQRAESDHAIAAEDHATLDEKISHKADIDGSYDGMAVGIARNLEGRTDVTDSFFERTTGGDAEVANGTAQLNEVKGKSQVWNQYIKPINATNIIGTNVTGLSFDNGVCSFTANTGDVNSRITFENPWAIANHKYFVSIIAKASNNGDIVIRMYGGYKLLTVSCTTEFSKSGFVFTAGSGWNFNSGIYSKVSGNTITFKNLMLFDLTLLGIDDLTTVEEVEAWLADNIGEMPYYPYNAGEVLNNRMTGVESIGFNLLDPATGKADIIGAYSDVYGNYYGITGTHGTLTFTDKFGNTETITPDEDGKFLLEKAGTLTVATPGEDCAVFLWWDGTQTEFKPYEKNVGALDVTHIYGKLNGEGEYVRVWPTGMPGIGDIKDSLKVVDGQVVAERKIGERDMGVLNWTASTNYMYTPDLIGTIQERPQNSGKDNIVCHKYTTIEGAYTKIVNATDDKLMVVVWGTSGSHGRFMVRDSAYSDAATFKAAMSGVLLYFELATPQVFTDLIYRDSESFADNTPVTLPVNYKVDNWGIERIAPQNTEEAVVTTKPELTMRYSIDAVEELNTHRDEIDDLYEKNEELDERKPEKYGDYPDMAVGSAKTLAGNDTKVEDFVFKALDCADGLAKLNSARGKSLVMNQLVQNGNFSDGTNGWNKSASNSWNVSNGVIEITKGESVNPIIYQVPNLKTSHKYLVRYDVKITSSAEGKTYTGYMATPTRWIGPYFDKSELADWVKVSEIVDAGADYSTIYFGAYAESQKQFDNGDKAYLRNIILIDLTLMFGAGNEPATVAEFEAMFPLPYYDYNAGEIISNKTEEVKVTGFNQWDEEWEVGAVSISGALITDPNRIRPKNYIPVFPNTEYNFYCGAFTSGSVHIIYYNKRGDTTSIGKNTIYASGSFTTPANCHFLKFSFETSVGYGNTYKGDVCINISDTAKNGTYEPYKTNTIELNLPTLTGKLNGEGESVVVFPDGLKSAGSVYDEIVGNKAIKRVGVADMGTLNWVMVGSGEYFVINPANLPQSLSAGATGNNLLSSKYVTKPKAGSATYYADDKAIWWHFANNWICVHDSAYSDAAIFKAAMDGVLLYYELATPEEYILDEPLPDTFQAYKGGTIKQLPENTSEPVTAPMVMLATYAIDIVGAYLAMPKEYLNVASLDNLIATLGSALNGTITKSWNEAQQRYTFTFTPNNS